MYFPEKETSYCSLLLFECLRQYRHLPTRACNGLSHFEFQEGQVDQTNRLKVYLL